MSVSKVFDIKHVLKGNNEGHQNSKCKQSFRSVAYIDIGAMLNRSVHMEHIKALLNISPIITNAILLPILI